jgi:hypothetical protein
MRDFVRWNNRHDNGNIFHLFKLYVLKTFVLAPIAATLFHGGNKADKNRKNYHSSLNKIIIFFEQINIFAYYKYL